MPVHGRGVRPDPKGRVPKPRSPLESSSLWEIRESDVRRLVLSGGENRVLARALELSPRSLNLPRDLFHFLVQEHV